LAEQLLAVERPHPVRAAITGIDTAGKTILADELGYALEERSGGRQVVRASIDDFQRPRAVRHRRGLDSPTGYYVDGFDFPALRRELLVPLGPGGNRKYRLASLNFEKDEPIQPPLLLAEPDAIVLVDGVFLLQKELAGEWDWSVFLRVDFETALERGAQRDAVRFGSARAARERYEKRYLPAQQLHLERDDPIRQAVRVVDNNNPDQPFFLR
jgi:uridine kinase